MRKILLIVFFMMFVVAGFAAKDVKKTVDIKKYAGKKIGKVTVVILDLFPGTKNFLKKIVNSIHVNTRESVIRDELLYKSGDLFDIRLIDESERILRRQKNFIVKQTKFALSKDGKHVDVIVTIQDVWSLYFNVQLGGAGGVQRYNFTLGERNFLGRNYSLETKLDINSFRNLFGQHFYIPNLGGSHWRFLEKVAFYFDKDGNHYGQLVELTLTYPLFSRRSKWGFMVQLSYDKAMEFKNDGNSIEQIDISGTNYDKKYFDTYTYLKVELVRSFGYEVKHNYGITFLTEKKSYNAYDGVSAAHMSDFFTQVLPNAGLGYARHRVSFDFSLNNFKYIKLRNFFEYNRIEDYALGLYLYASVGVSRKLWGSDENALYLRGELSHTFLVGNNYIFKLKVDYTSDFPQASSIWAGGERNSIVGFYTEHYLRNLPLGFMAMRLTWKRGSGLDTDTTLTLGAGNGLRGYQDNRFEGDDLAFLNLEYRFDPIVIDFVNIGFVLFFDCGAIWGSKDPDVRNGYFYPALGFGVRFTFPQLNPNVFRLDFGINFGNDSTKFEDLIAFGYGQAF